MAQAQLDVVGFRLCQDGYYEKWLKKLVHFARDYDDDGSDPVVYLEIW